MEFTGYTAHEVYAAAVAATLELGVKRAPRGEPTFDLGYVSMVVMDPKQSLITGTRPNYNTRIAMIEALQIIGEFSDPELVTTASPKFERYRENTGQFHGAYGMRVRGQIKHVIRKLRDDPDSRQAVVTIWDPFMDNQRSKSDYPCTVMLQFEMRNNVLCMNTVMRSNDVHLGLPYDLFQFCQLQCSVANALDVDPGPYRHTTLSLHAYERDIEALELVDIRNADSDALQPEGIGFKGTSWGVIVQRANDIAYDRMPEEHMTPSERWFMVRAHTVIDERDARRRLKSASSTV